MVDDEADLRVARVPEAVTEALRSRVLRPDDPDDRVLLPPDGPHRLATFAAFPVTDSPVAEAPIATVTVGPEACWWRDDVARPWRLKWMAADESWQGRGVGRLVLAAALAHVADEGADLLWCNARRRAVSFYERAGFTIDGPEFDIEGIGPHHPMSRPPT